MHVFIIPSFGLMFESELFFNPTYPYLVTFMLEIMQDIKMFCLTLKVKGTTFFSSLGGFVFLFHNLTPWQSNVIYLLYNIILNCKIASDWN